MIIYGLLVTHDYDAGTVQPEWQHQILSTITPDLKELDVTSHLFTKILHLVKNVLSVVPINGVTLPHCMHTHIYTYVYIYMHICV
jgi:hypothetical protein